MTLLIEQDRQAEISSLNQLLKLKSPRKSSVARDISTVAVATAATLLFAYGIVELGTQVWRALTCC
jgi:hypothetical protein